MKYFIKRGEENFGPYSLSEVQEYVQSGRVIITDLAQSEGMPNWVPVSQILGNIPAPAIAPAAPAVYATVPLVDLPPNLHWGLLLLLNLITRQLFNIIWAFVLANWARKLSGDNKPMVLVAMYPAALFAAIFGAAIIGGMGGEKNFALLIIFVCIIGGLIAYLFGIFKIRDAMEEYYNSRENIGLTLSGVMTFFFSTIYLQYHVNRIARWKKTGTLS
jgi:GYF domain 2